MASQPGPPRSLATPPAFILSSRAGAHLTLVERARGGVAAGPAVVHIFVLEDWLIRVAVLPSGAWASPRTWTLAPGARAGACDAAEAGRASADVSGFSCPAYALSAGDDALVVETAALRLRAALAGPGGLHCAWE